MSTSKNILIEPAEVPGDKAFGYVGLKHTIEASSGAHAATLGAEDSGIAKQFRKYFRRNGPDRWRSVGCGKPVPQETDFPKGAGVYVVRVIERRLFVVQNRSVTEKGSPLRFAHRVTRKNKTPVT